MQRPCSSPGPLTHGVYIMKTSHRDTQDDNQRPHESTSVSHVEALQSQDAQVHRRLYVATALTLSIATLIIIHEGFLLVQLPQRGIHSFAHVLLLVMAALVIISSRILWRSYQVLNQYQASLVTRNDMLKESVQGRTRALEKSESLLVSMFNAFEERTVVVDADTRILRANKAAITWTGDDPSGYLFTEVFPECNPESERRSEHRLIKVTFDTATIHRNRLIRGGRDCASMLSIDTYPVINREGKVRLVIEVARDVTKETEDDILTRHREKMAALGMLAAGFAHELGNPLTSLSTELELLERNPDNSHLQESVAMLKEHLGRITRILHQVRGFAQKRSSGAMETSIKKVIGEALRLVSFDPRAKGIKIQVDASDGLHPAQMQEDDLHLVLINLIINAFEAMPDGGTLTITAQPERTGGSCLTVSDTGVGMEPNVLSRATFPLFTTKHETTGTGLGLAMCTDLLHAAGARLNISSTPGKGTTVKINFPDPDKQD